MIVHFGWTESRLSKLRLRLFFTLTPFIIALGLAIPPLFLEMYNYSGLFSCFIAPYPLDCEWRADVDCIRGQGAWNYWDAFCGYCFVANVIIAAFVVLLVYTVFKQERTTDKYLTPGQARRRDNTTKTAWQGLRYVGAFFLAYFTLFIFAGYRIAEKVPPLAIFYLHLILTPMLGLFNSFVYFRPRYIAHRDANPDDSWILNLGSIFNVSLDYLEARRSKFSSRTSGTLSRRFTTGSVSATIASRFAGGSGSERSGNDGSDGDLTSPLFQDSEESRDDSRSTV